MSASITPGDSAGTYVRTRRGLISAGAYPGSAWLRTEGPAKVSSLRRNSFHISNGRRTSFLFGILNYIIATVVTTASFT